MNSHSPDADPTPTPSAAVMNPPTTGFPYALRIGVTGHRHLHDPQALASAVSRVLEHIDAVLGPQSRTPLEWTIVSPLARGADRLVVEAVLGRPQSRLEVLIPFELDEYRRDFVDAQDREHFERLLKQADSVQKVYEHPSLDTTDPDALHEWRNRGYLQVGQAVIDACEIVIAIWDGRPSRGLGGTGDIIPYALSRKRLVIWVDALHPQQAPQVIRVSSSAAAPLPQPLPTQPLPTTAKQLSLGYHQLDAYNRDDSLSADVIDAARRQTQAWFEQQARDCLVSESEFAPLLRRLLPHLSRADRLAVHYRDRYIAATTGLFSLSAIAVSVAAVQVLFFPEQLWIVVLELLAMAIAVLLWTWCRREAWHEKWIHDRYLAERLRLSIFTLLLDAPDARRPSDPGRLLPFYSGPRQWLLDTVRRVVRESRQAPETPLRFTLVKEFLTRAWLLDQQHYHARNARRKHQLAYRGHRLGMVLFVATILMALLHLAGVGHHAEAHAPGWQRLDAWISLGTILFPVWGAAIHAIINQLEWERIAARSQRMNIVLKLVLDRAQDAQSLDELRTAVTEGEQLMSLENHEWWILLSFRQPILPT